MQATLAKLSGLVKRRGQTNDPTQEIALCTRQLEMDAKELADIVQSMRKIPTRTSQHKKHLDLVAAWLQTVASDQTSKLKEILKLRGNILADQAQRRKLLNPQANAQNGTAARSGRVPVVKPNQAAMMNSPLFTMTQQTSARASRPPVSSGTNGSNHSNGSAAAVPTKRNSYATTTTAAYYGASAAAANSTSSAGYGGYGGYGGAATTTGMRQRRTIGGPSNPQQDDASNIQTQIQERQVQRETQTRLEQATQAERTLASLGTLFGKMSTLISQQGEMVEKLEDDVESAMLDVSAGQEEIQTLYGMKKGNRSLIIKVFAILIFFILFMRLY
jgi:syntaxin 5